MAVVYVGSRLGKRREGLGESRCRRSGIPALCRHGVWVLLFVAGCSTPLPEPASYPARIARAVEGVEDDPLIEARRAGVEAARAREEEPAPIDEFQLRIGEDYLDKEHDLRLTARVPIKRPAEIRAQRQVLRAETEIALSRLEEALAKERGNDGPYFNGDQLCLVDAAYAPFLQRFLIVERWLQSGLLDDYPLVNAWANALLADAAVSESVPDNFLDEFLGGIQRSGLYVASLMESAPA